MDLVTQKAIQAFIGIKIFAFFPPIWNNWVEHRHKKTK